MLEYLVKNRTRNKQLVSLLRMLDPWTGKRAAHTTLPTAMLTSLAPLATPSASLAATPFASLAATPATTLAPLAAPSATPSATLAPLVTPSASPGASLAAASSASSNVTLPTFTGTLDALLDPSHDNSSVVLLPASLPASLAPTSTATLDTLVTSTLPGALPDAVSAPPAEKRRGKQKYLTLHYREPQFQVDPLLPEEYHPLVKELQLSRELLRGALDDTRIAFLPEPIIKQLRGAANALHLTPPKHSLRSEVHCEPVEFLERWQPDVVTQKLETRGCTRVRSFITREQATTALWIILGEDQTEQIPIAGKVQMHMPTRLDGLLDTMLQTVRQLPFARDYVRLSHAALEAYEFQGRQMLHLDTLYRHVVTIVHCTEGAATEFSAIPYAPGQDPRTAPVPHPEEPCTPFQMAQQGDASIFWGNSYHAGPMHTGGNARVVLFVLYGPPAMEYPENYQLQPWALMQELGAFCDSEVLVCIIQYALAGYHPLRHIKNQGIDRLLMAMDCFLRRFCGKQCLQGMHVHCH